MHKNSEYFSLNLEIEHDKIKKLLWMLFGLIYNDTVIQNRAFKLSEIMYGHKPLKVTSLMHGANTGQKTARI